MYLSKQVQLHYMVSFCFMEANKSHVFDTVWTPYDMTQKCQPENLPFNSNVFARVRCSEWLSPRRVQSNKKYGSLCVVLILIVLRPNDATQHRA